MRLSDTLQHVVNFCYPGWCANCLGASEGAEPLCEVCQVELTALECAPACEKCAMPLSQPDAPCAHCEGKGVYPFETILRLGVFVDPLKHLIHQMKYHRRWGLAEVFADYLRTQPRVTALLDYADCVVPVPLHPFRQIARGYNQADLIARRLRRGRRRIARINPMERLKRTESQTHLSHTKRIENMRAAFGLRDPDLVRDKHVVVVDDVMTSGATLQAVGRALKGGHPASISAIVVARADPLQRGFETI